MCQYTIGILEKLYINYYAKIGIIHLDPTLLQQWTDYISFNNSQSSDKVNKLFK